MPRPSVEQGRRRGTLAGGIFAFTVHLAILGLLALSSPRLFYTSRDARAISVDLIAPSEPAALQPRIASRAAPSKKDVGSPPAGIVDAAAPPPQANVAGVGVTAPPAEPAPTPSQDARPPGLALRNTVIGCAFSGMIQFSEAEKRHCHDVFAAGAKDGPDLSRFAVSPASKAAFDAAADRENFLQKPVLSQRPKNGCKPFVGHQQFAQLGASRDAYSVSFGCGKSF
jgi:hypothetical protein